jgi:cell cycle arrest protein BUB3
VEFHFAEWAPRKRKLPLAVSRTTAHHHEVSVQMVIGLFNKSFDLGMTFAEFQISPDEGISSVHFSPSDPSLLCTSTWSGHIHVYSASNYSEVSSFPFPVPLLCSTWLTDETIAAGSIDGTIFLTDQQILTGHESGVSALSSAPDLSALISSSWDTTVRIWDPRASPDQNHTTIFLKEKILTCVPSSNYSVVAHGSKNNVYLFDLRNPSEIEKRVSSLGYQIRSSAASKPNDFGWAIGSIDGRIAIDYFGDIQHQAQRFSFSHQKHEEGQEVVIYPVSALCFNPQSGILASGSCQGNITFWDLDAKRKVSEIQSPFDVSVAGLDCSQDGSMLAIAFSYTWEEGEIEHPPDRLVVETSGGNG